ncbi:MAG: BatA domain-containing protein [Puniceicoccales bacterium]|nr:BatA domain-containing protein [Puniceicoccales bacterium]
MNIIFLYPHVLLFLLILPIFKGIYRKHVRQPSILIPNVSLLKKIIGRRIKPSGHSLIHCRILAVLLLLLAYSEPMIVMETLIIRCNYYLVMASLACFLLEMFLRNTSLQKIP